MATTKTYQVAAFKALPDENGTKGRFEAMVSVFGNVDLQGDRVMKGAFTGSLAKWRESGDPIPLVWSHEWANPFAHIGTADPKLAEETDDGLKVVGNIDTSDPFGAQVYKLLKERRVKEFSFAYDIIEEREAEDGANELKVLDLIETGPTLKGANPSTELLGVKKQLEEAKHESDEEAEAEHLAKVIGALAAEGIEGEKAASIVRAMGLVPEVDETETQAKSGRALSSKNERLVKEAVDAIKSAAGTLDSVLAEVQTQSEPEEKATEPVVEPEEEEPEVEVEVEVETDESDPLVMLARIEELDSNF